MKHAHDQWINVLSELGIVGLVLFVVALGGLLFAALRPVGRAARDADRGLLAALQAVSVAFVFHMTIDWDWDMAAAAIAFLLLTGVAAAYVRRRRADALRGVAQAAPAPDGEPAVRRRAWREPRGLRFGVASRILVTGVLLLVALSWLSPYLSQRSLSRAILLASESRTSAAIVQARRAHRFDPLAVDPLFTLALVEQQQGRGAAAQATLEQAVRLQPQNYATYYELGLMQLNVLGLTTRRRRRSGGRSHSTPTTRTRATSSAPPWLRPPHPERDRGGRAACAATGLGAGTARGGRLGARERE